MRVILLISKIERERGDKSHGKFSTNTSILSLFFLPEVEATFQINLNKPGIKNCNLEKNKTNNKILTRFDSNKISNKIRMRNVKK